MSYRNQRFHSRMHKTQQKRRATLMKTSLDETTGTSAPPATCLCGCGQAIDTSKSRGKPRLHFSDTCRKRYYRQMQSLIVT